MSESNKSGADEKSMDKRGSVFRRWQIWVGLVAVVIAVVWGTSTLAGLVSGFGVDETSVASSSSAEPPSSVQTFSAPVHRPGAQPSVTSSMLRRRTVPNYRLAATVANEDDPSRSVALITDGDHMTTIPLKDCKALAAGEYACRYNGFIVDVFGARDASL